MRVFAGRSLLNLPLLLPVVVVLSVGAAVLEASLGRSLAFGLFALVVGVAWALETDIRVCSVAADKLIVRTLFRGERSYIRGAVEIGYDVRYGTNGYVNIKVGIVDPHGGVAALTTATGFGYPRAAAHARKIGARLAEHLGVRVGEFGLESAEVEAEVVRSTSRTWFSVRAGIAILVAVAALAGAVGFLAMTR